MINVFHFNVRFVHLENVGEIRSWRRSRSNSAWNSPRNMLDFANSDPDFTDFIKTIIIGDKIGVYGLCPICSVILHENENLTSLYSMCNNQELMRPTFMESEGFWDLKFPLYLVLEHTSIRPGLDKYLVYANS